MENKTEKEIHDAAIEKWGFDSQLTVANEELAELIQAVCKFKRDPDDEKHKRNIIKELADVKNVTEQIKNILCKYYGMSIDELNELIELDYQDVLIELDSRLQFADIEKDCIFGVEKDCVNSSNQTGKCKFKSCPLRFQYTEVKGSE